MGLAGAIPPATAQDSTRDLSVLLDGVSAIDKPGAPGPLVVWGDNAFPILAGQSGDAMEPLVAAAQWGAGRVVVFGHNGYLKSTGNDTARLRRNAIAWCAGEKAARKPSVALWKSANGLEAELNAAGFRAETLEELARLSKYDVAVLDTGSLKEEKERETVRTFVEKGGGLVCGSLGWGWLQLNNGKTIQDHPGNHLLFDVGIAWADGTIAPTGEGDAYLARTHPLAHVGKAIDALARAPGKEDATQALAVLSRALRTIPESAPGFGDRLEKLLASGGDRPPVPSPDHPVTTDDPLARVLLSVTCGRVTTAAPESIGAHPAAREFPGEVKKETPSVVANRVVNSKLSGWHSLGLYAPPGALIHVRIPEEAADAGLEARIGCHSDRLYHLDKWTRAPEISFTWPLRQAVTKMANPFGGLVYLVVPGRFAIEDIKVDVAGAVESPLYELGKTSPSDWQRAVRSTGAPWAEFASGRVVVSVPTEVARSVRDPEELMKTWDRVLLLEDQLRTVSKEGDRPERIVCDRQISAGYMHSGYPVMVGMDQAEHLASAENLSKEGNWGFFHEFGHNHQRGDWTFDGTGEVTCNLFSLYVFDKLCGVPPEEHKRGNEEFREKKMQDYFALGRRSFDKWKSDPFIALVPYIQMQQEFGWEMFQKVFAEYEALQDSERPKSDDEKRDQWMVRFSKAAGRNLGPFFRAWNIPVSESALADIAGLDPWMPGELDRFVKQ